MKYHFIAIGGSVMHNLAIALRNMGHVISGSDDVIYEPSRTLLESHGLLPAEEGWDANRIQPDIDAVILGMHARKDNPELVRALDLGLPVYSFPEFVARHAQDKTRVVIGGSHGKTTTVSMIMHVLNSTGHDFDYLVGARLEGFDTMVKLTDADLMIIEGDEYLSSALDPRPKFLHYEPHISVLTGIAWDHMNVFPTFENYLDQFANFLEHIEEGMTLFYFEGDPKLKSLVQHNGAHLKTVSYQMIPHRIDRKGSIVQAGGKEIVLPVYGSHNFQNMAAAVQVCRTLGLSDSKIFESLATFKGAARRLETVYETPHSIAIRDFAHAPSKVRATVKAVRERFPEKYLVACLELHTYSSLNKAFIPEYAGSMDAADAAAVIYDPGTLEIKKLPPLASDEIKSAFKNTNLQIFTRADDLPGWLSFLPKQDIALLWMSSGHFGGLDIPGLSRQILEE